MWPWKAFYALYYGAAVSLVPFIVIYYDSLGFTGRQIGVLSAIPPLVILISAPLWGMLADASRQHKRLLLAAIAGTMGTVVVLGLTSSFNWLIPVVILYAFFVAPVMPLTDASVLDMLGSQRRRYGRLRAWGAVGWGVAAPLTGYMIDQSGIEWAFYGYLILMFGGLVVAWLLPIRKTPMAQRFGRNLWVLLSNARWLLFLSIIFISGMCMAVINSYLFLYLNDLGASESLMGLSLTVATISEVPILFYSDRLLIRWGARGLLMISLMAYVVRALAYSFMHAPWIVLPIHLLHGLTFSAMWVAGVSYADEIAPQGLGATAQGLFSGVLLGLGGMAGGLVGGILYDSVGPVTLYRLVAAAAAAGLVIFALAGPEAGTTKPALVEVPTTRANE